MSQLHKRRPLRYGIFTTTLIVGIAMVVISVLGVLVSGAIMLIQFGFFGMHPAAALTQFAGAAGVALITFIIGWIVIIVEVFRRA